MCFGVGIRIHKRTQAGTDDDDDVEKTKQTLLDVDVNAGRPANAFNEHQSRRVSLAGTRPQMGYGTRRLDRQAARSSSRDDQPASAAPFCAREAPV